MMEHRPVDAATVAALRFLDEDGHAVGPADWQGQVTLLVFLRWLG